MAKLLPDIREEARQFLKDEFASGTDLTWEDDELNLHIQKVLGEISRVSPSVVLEVCLTTASSRILDISGISDIMWIEKAEYPVGNNPRTYKNVIWRDNETVEIDTTLSPVEGTSGTLTGTITFTSGSTAVTGSGSDFDGELAADYHIKPSTKTRWYRIASVTDDTNLVLVEPVRSGDAGEDTEDATNYYTDEVAYLFCAKPHTLTEASSTLRPQHEMLLVDGVMAHAAISKSRDYINTQNISGKALSEMLLWGQNKLALYKQDLAYLRRSVPYQEYARG